MPPNFAFQAYKVGCDVPCLRHTSGTFIPASCSRRAPMIWSSVNRLRFIHPPPPGSRTLLQLGGFFGAQVSGLADGALMEAPSRRCRGSRGYAVFLDADPQTRVSSYALI